MTITKGVVAVFIDETGHVIASASDFKTDRPGGFSVQEAQSARARSALTWAVMNAYASPRLVRGLHSYQAEETIRRLVNDHGCQVAVISVGHGEETPEDG